MIPRVTRPAGHNLQQRTDSARIKILQLAAAGDCEAITYLRDDAAWFPLSASNPKRAHKPRSADAEIRAEAARYLATVYPAVATKAANARASTRDHGWRRACARAQGRRPSGERSPARGGAR